MEEESLRKFDVGLDPLDTDDDIKKLMKRQRTE